MTIFVPIDRYQCVSYPIHIYYAVGYLPKHTQSADLSKTSLTISKIKNHSKNGSNLTGYKCKVNLVYIIRSNGTNPTFTGKQDDVDPSWQTCQLFHQLE